MIFSASTQAVSFVSYADAALRIPGGQIEIPAASELPFEVREASLEWGEGRYRVRLTCSHEVSPYAARLHAYLQIGPGAAAYTIEVRRVEVLLYLQETPQNLYR